MKKRIVFLYIFLAISFSSCYELIEEVAVNRNGSGTMRIILNCSESKAKIAAAMLVGNTNDSDVPDKTSIQQTVSKVQTVLSKVAGISAVDFTVDYNTYVAVLKFNFTDVARINAAIKTLSTIYAVNGNLLPSYGYDKATGVFEKNYNYTSDAQARYRQLKQSRKDVIEGGQGITVCRFSTPVKSWSNKNARLLTSKSGVVQRFPVKDFVNGLVPLSNKIQLSN